MVHSLTTHGYTSNNHPTKLGWKRSTDTRHNTKAWPCLISSFVRNKRRLYNEKHSESYDDARRRNPLSHNTNVSPPPPLVRGKTRETRPTYNTRLPTLNKKRGPIWRELRWKVSSVPFFQATSTTKTLRTRERKKYEQKLPASLGATASFPLSINPKTAAGACRGQPLLLWSLLLSPLTTHRARTSTFRHVPAGRAIVQKAVLTTIAPRGPP